MSSNPPCRILRFGTFEVNLDSGELRQRGQKVKLQEQPFQVLAALLRMGFKGGWKSLLKKNPEPTKAQVMETVAMIRAYKNAPHNLRSLIKQKMKEMPHAPGGPPRKIKPQEEKTVCSEIIALRAELDTRGAIKRVAAKRGVSERTIYRIWGKHYPNKKAKKT